MPGISNFAAIIGSVSSEVNRNTLSQFVALVGHKGVLVVGGPEEVAEKLLRHSEALGGIDRFTFQMDNAGLTHEQLMSSINLIGTKVMPLLKAAA